VIKMEIARKPDRCHTHMVPYDSDNAPRAERSYMRCYACQQVLIYDGPPHEPTEYTVTLNGEPIGEPIEEGGPDAYQFDNAMWIGFHGGYGMFVDNMDVSWPANGMDRFDDEGNENPGWKPEYVEKRILKGADYEAVICHDCAHAACEALPWMARLLNPVHSHAHRGEYHGQHPDHIGWDFFNCCNRPEHSQEAWDAATKRTP